MEILVPWTVATMRDGNAPTRTVGVFFDRLLASTREVYAYPTADPDRSRFVSEFHRIEIPQYRDSLLHLFPYATAQRDLIRGDSELEAGADLFWKPSASFQLSAALNPDFGQVEADELVVKLDAIETFFSDKRPLFTENQGFFDLRTPDEGLLVYTRRIGGPSDDGSGLAADIDAALKLNGSTGALSYGLLTVEEADSAGRSFHVARLFRPIAEGMTLGWLGTRTERPLLDRTADVHTIDFSWQPDESLLINAQALTSTIDASDERITGDGAWLRALWAPAEHWQYELEATHFGRDLDFNDLGFQRRASVNQLELAGEHSHRVTDDESFLSNIRWRAETHLRTNDSGDELPAQLRLLQTNDLRRGDRLEIRADLESAGIDDLIARDHGHWERPTRQRLLTTYRMPLRGAWQLGGDVDVYEEGLRGYAVKLKLTLNWYPRDDFNLQLTTGPIRSADWLVWEGDRDFGRYHRRTHFFALDGNWFPGRAHELRLKAQWLAIDARSGSRYVLDDEGEMLPTHTALPDFTVNNFGVQLRYRYEFATQSELYLVYSRGGLLREVGASGSSFDLLDDAVGLRDADQFLAKLRYRF